MKKLRKKTEGLFLRSKNFFRFSVFRSKLRKNYEFATKDPLKPVNACKNSLLFFEIDFKMNFYTDLFQQSNNYALLFYATMIDKFNFFN